MGSSTFRGRLTKALAVSSAAFLSIFCLVLYLWCRSAFLADLDGDLEAIFRADFAATRTKELARGFEQGSGFVSPEESHVFKLLLDLDGNLIGGSEKGVKPALWLAPAVLKDALEKEIAYLDLRYLSTLYRTLIVPVRRDSRTLIEVIGLSQEPMQESLEQLRQVLAISLCVGIVLVTFVSNRVAAYLTSPLEHILTQLESVTSKSDLKLRLTGSYRDREMVSLRDQVNAMLERLEASFRSQQQFTSNASHELRAPLGNLTLAIEVCLRHPRQAEEYRETLEICLGETKRLTAMSNQLLQLSRSDEGGLTVSPEPIDLYALAQKSLARKEIVAMDKGVSLNVTGEELLISGDPFMLGQVLDNLLDNAIRYSPSGATVLVTTARCGDFAEIAVVDVGSGIPADKLNHVFERFYRADPSRQRETGGFGLGLAISQAIAQAHGGELITESSPGKGTTFTLKLPFQKVIAVAGSSI